MFIKFSFQNYVYKFSLKAYLKIKFTICYKIDFKFGFRNFKFDL